MTLGHALDHGLTAEEGAERVHLKYAPRALRVQLVDRPAASHGPGIVDVAGHRAENAAQSNVYVATGHV